jgi:EAL domain-containing protein (putative c-di-GMP-specific phosphodiesterase class I)
MNSVAAFDVVDFSGVISEGLLCKELAEILKTQNFSALFQPIMDMRRATIIGYEGLIRGPSDSVLHADA